MRWLAGVALTLPFTFGACGGTTTDIADGGDASSPTKDAGSDVVGQPPPPVDGGPATTTTTTYALQTIFLGETDRNGNASSTAWKAYGFNLDGLVTAKTSTDVCTLQPGSPTANQVDGNNGIDNSWGETLLPLIQTATGQPNPSQTETGYIDTGTWTVQLVITGLSTDPKQTATGLVASIFTSGQYDNGTPAFDSTTDWPVLSTSVVDGQNVSSGSTMVFPSAYVNGGTFVSGKGPDPLILSLNFNGVPVELHIHDAIITFDHTAAASLTNGTIAGVLDTQEFVATMKSVAGQFSTALCGTAFDGIAQQIEQASDILSNGTNAPGTPCTGISVAMGFNATAIANPTKVAQPPPPPPNPCQ